MRNKIEAMHKEYGTAPGRRGDCCNFIRYQRGNTSCNKCAAYGDTHSEATDWRGPYLACGLYNMPFEDLVPHRRPLVEVRARRQKDDEMISGQIEL